MLYAVENVKEVLDHLVKLELGIFPCCRTYEVHEFTILDKTAPNSDSILAVVDG